MKPQLSLCVGDYDINRALLTGEVEVRGVDLITMTDNSPHRHWRMARHGEFHVAEFSMAKVTMLEPGGTGPAALAIPAFPHRRFRHGFIFVAQSSPLSEPRDLNGRRIGLRSWQNTAGMWVRGMLQDFYGLDLSTVEWVTQDDEDIEIPGKTLGRLQRAPRGSNVFDMLAAGQLDALIYPESPPGVRSPSSPVRTLFPDPKQAESEFYRSTGLFPIMHTVVVRLDVLEKYPWVAVNLLEAFRSSKDAAFKKMLDPRSVSLAWLAQARAEQEAILGEDPWKYNFADNRDQIQRMLDWSLQQGLSTRGRSAEELFVPSTIDEAPELVSI